MERINIIIVTQARVGSSRFPGKVLKPLGSSTLLGLHLTRLKQSKLADKIILATTYEQKSDEIIFIANKAGVEVFQGSTNDVLSRFYLAVEKYNPIYVVRVTSDCPLIDPSLIDEVITMTQKNKLDYGTNALEELFPDGQDIEVFTFEALRKAWNEAVLESEREHVTPYIRKNASLNNGLLFKSMNFPPQDNFSHVRMTVDEPSDLETIQLLIEQLGTESDWKTYADFILKHREKLTNQTIIRNEGYLNSLKNDKKIING